MAPTHSVSISSGHVYVNTTCAMNRLETRAPNTKQCFWHKVLFLVMVSSISSPLLFWTPLTWLTYARNMLHCGTCFCIKPESFSKYWSLFCKEEYVLLSYLHNYSKYGLLAQYSQKYIPTVAHLQNLWCMSDNISI